MMSTRHPLTVTLNETTDRSYPIYFSPLGQLPRLMLDEGLRLGRCLVVTDARVAELYGDLLTEALQSFGWRPAVHAIPRGEMSKRYDILTSVLDWALNLGIDRKTPVVALGGGVVGDLAGFAAAILLRGIPLVQVPTTLVAQVDSAIGGKTGINHDVGKNLIGSFHQPRLVLADTSLLLSLDEREWTSGLAETVKHALIADDKLYERLRSDWDAVLSRNLDVASPLIAQSAGVKVDIVSQDEREAGIRALLNFGHTFGHAIEKSSGYDAFTHGEAVAAGMVAALHLSMALQPELEVSGALDLVGRIPIEPSLASLSIDSLMEAMQADKKRLGRQLRLVVLEAIGRATVVTDVEEELVRAAWQSLLA